MICMIMHHNVHCIREYPHYNFAYRNIQKYFKQILPVHVRKMIKYIKNEAHVAAMHEDACLCTNRLKV